MQMVMMMGWIEQPIGRSLAYIEGTPDRTKKWELMRRVLGKV